MKSETPSNLSLEIRAGQFSDAGVKAGNDDAIGIRVPDEPLLATKGVAAVISDGVSSSEGGREAAEACVRGFLTDYYSTPESWTVKTSGQRILGALNRWLYSQSQSRFAREAAMLSTLSALVVKSGTAHLFHVGDTRIHRLREGDLECLTRDHTSWSAGEKTFLGRAMGADLHLDIDYRSLPVEEGDTFLLTTDGVHEFIGLTELRSTLVRLRESPEQAAREIVALALAAGSQDNASCQVIRVERIGSLDEEAFYRQLTELPFPPPLEPGMVLDGYRILRELHASKRTQVYAAQEVKSGRKVVIKTPSVNFEDDPQYIDQFLHEEWVGRRIENEHVLRVLEPVGRRRFLYYVTEYVEGQTLRQWMESHPLPSPVEVRDIIEQIAAGLRQFHRLEMVHRDLKPENILVDPTGRVLIIDFGSTKIAGIEEISTPVERNPMLGTLDYAAPEYFRGENGSPRSDIFALGVIAYEMFTGRLPYGKPLSPGRLRNPPRYVPVKRYLPEIPIWVDAAIERAVSLDPGDRYGLLSELVHDLGHPNPEFTRRESEPLLQRNPVAFWRLLAGVELVIIVLLITLLV